MKRLPEVLRLIACAVGLAVVGALHAAPPVAAADQPDLAWSSLPSSLELNRTSWTQIDVGVANRGTAASGSSWFGRFYFSTDAVLDDQTDPVLGGSGSSVLEAGASATAPASLGLYNLPDLAPG